MESLRPHQPTTRRDGTPILPRGQWRSRRRATRRTPRWHRRPSRYPRAHPTLRWLLPASTRRPRPIQFRRRRNRNREPAQRHRHSKSHRSSGPHRNHPRTTLRLPRPRLLLPRPRSDRRPSTKHLLRGRQTWLRSSPSDRHRPCTRRRLLPRDLLLRHVRHPHQGHPSVQFRCVDGFSTPTSIGPRLVGQRSRSQSDRCPAGVVDFDVHDDVVNGLAAPHSQ